MKNRTTILFVCLLLALAQGDLINWAGNWDIMTTDPKDTACYPAGTVVITQALGTVTASWTWDNTAPCTTAKIANTQFTQTVPTPAKNEIDLKLKVGGADIDGTFTITGDEAVFSSKNDASSTYSRRKQVVNWYGNWDIVTKDEKLCNPDGTITISDYSSSRVRAQWTWAKTQPCIDAKLDGVTFNEVIYISGNTVPVSFTVGEAKVEGIFAIINDQAVFANANGAAATFVRRQQLVNWVGVWDINQGSKSSGGCYPDGYITIIPEGGNLTSSWVWEKSDICKQANLDGKTFTQSQPVPKGNGAFLDFIVGGAHVSGLFSCSSDGKSCNFASTKGASASFSRRTQLVNWAGVFDIATKDSTACYPDGAITVVRTTEKATDKTAATDKLTISWTWAKTDACKNLGLTGEVKKAVDTPTSGNSVSLDALGSATAPVTGLLTLFLDGAVFSIASGAATTYSRRQENVAFAGTWDIQNPVSETACYPNKSVIITQSGGNVVAKWTWAESAYCKGAGLNGKEFSQTTPSPKGRAIFLDIVVGSTETTITRISGLFSVNGNTAAFDSSNGASATFTRVSAPPSNGGGSWGTIIIVLLVIVALGVGGYLYVQNRNKKLQSGLDNSISGAYTRT